MGKNTENSKSPQIFSFSVNREFLPYILLFLGAFILFSLLSFEEKDSGIDANVFGRIGFYFSYGLFFLFGKAGYVPAVVIVSFALVLFKNKEIDLISRIVSIPLLLISASLLLNSVEVTSESVKDAGGFFGEKISFALEYILGKSGKLIFVVLIFLYSFLILLKESPVNLFKKIYHLFESQLKRDKNTISKKNLFNFEDVVTSKKRYELLPWVQIGKRADEVSKERESDQFEIISEKFELAEKPKVHRKKTIYDGFFEDKMVFKFQRSSDELVDKLTDIPVNFHSLNEEEKSILDLPKYNEVMFEEEHSTNVILGLEPDDKKIDQPEIKICETETVDPEIEIQSDEYQKIEEAFVAKDQPKEEIEEKDLRLFPNPSTSVPEIKLKKSFYNISRDLLSATHHLNKDPLFKMEAEVVAKKIEEIIKEYGYDSRVVSYEKGPIITRYELTPPPGVKLGRITSLSDELRLYLAVKSIRIVAPIPGKSTIGIEVPNKHRENVLLGDIVREASALKSSKDLTIPLGKDISGKNILIDLNKLPHLLVAGTTGSGKSVAMNSMISSLLFAKSPEEVRFLMIDPKIVEFAPYENVPHLLMPVVTDPRKAAKALAWAVQEMEARYYNVSNLKCRDLKSYNEKVEQPQFKNKHKKMPYIIIFIDELSDLMMVSGKELEDYITRISQKSRAVGIHLVMATQRPSVDVITGLIKANCPARIAFHVAQKTDSKIILDYNGADTLLGKGDMLYKSPTSSDLQRVQAPFVSEDEIEKIVDECKKFGSPAFVDICLEEETLSEDLTEEDEGLFDEAWEIVKTDRKASASYLQRRMRIGYNKAARIMELLEEKGYVGPQIGSKQREILKT